MEVRLEMGKKEGIGGSGGDRSGGGEKGRGAGDGRRGDREEGMVEKPSGKNRKT